MQGSDCLKYMCMFILQDIQKHKDNETEMHGKPFSPGTLMLARYVSLAIPKVTSVI